MRGAGFGAELTWTWPALGAGGDGWQLVGVGSASSFRHCRQMTRPLWAPATGQDADGGRGGRPCGDGGEVLSCAADSQCQAGIGSRHQRSTRLTFKTGVCFSHSERYTHTVRFG